MFGIIGYNFFSDKSALSSPPSYVPNITETKLENAIFDHFNITNNINLPYDTTKPDEWTSNTIINASFDGNINGGNSNLSGGADFTIKIKRRIVGDPEWITIHEYPAGSIEDFGFIYTDYLNAYGELYEYAIVPVDHGIEGDYIIQTIYSEFDGVYLCDAENSYRLFYDVGYGSNGRNQRTGTFEPLGRQFPIIVANGELSYESGSVSATVLNPEFEVNGELDRKGIVQTKKNLKDYLTNKKAKILKDWNGNYWVVMITNSPQINYLNGSGMGIPHVSFDWEEISKSDTQQDLYDAGILNTPPN